MKKPPVNILLVDDEVRNLEVLESILASPDYRLVRAQTAQEALMALLEGEFAAIVLDIQMPGTSGIELAHLIKERKKTQHIPIIFLTAYYQEDKDVLHGYEVGAVDYLTKPIDSRILKSKIAVFAELFQKNRELAALNGDMKSEIVQRQKAQDALRQANNELEARVQERTAELSQANDGLRAGERAFEEVLAREKAARQAAEAANRAKDDFLAALSHELRTPLNPVLLLASEAAHNLELPAAVRADFDMIARNISLEARLIDDLLDLTRITRGKLALDLHIVDVHEVLQDALSAVRSELEGKQISLSLGLEATERLVQGDGVRLTQVFWNVLKNAVKFTPENGKITVQTRTLTDSDEFIVTVSDTGIGMTTDELQRVFEAFSQGEHAREGGSYRFGGLGLGLAISRRLVELHSGSIHAASDGRNQGAAFSIRFPLAQKPGINGDGLSAEFQVPAMEPPSKQRGDSICVLLVEDHEPTRTALAQLLSRRHYQVEIAGSLAEARVLAGKKVFQILISDIGLPDGEGYDLMMELGKRQAVKGIALTGYGMEHDIARSHSAGFVAHLTKPVRVESLETALAAAIPH